jgi:hypothetical protein
MSEPPLIERGVERVVERVLDRFPERGPLPHIEIPDAFTGFFSSAHRATCRSINFSVKAFSGQRARAFDDRSLPALPRRPWSGWHAALDEFVMIYFELGRSGEFEQLDFERLEFEIENLIEHHDHRGVTDDPFTHHDDPPAPDEYDIVPRTLDGGDGEWMTFASEWEPHPQAPGRQRWLDDTVNGTVHVALLRHHDGPRPWVMFIHGAEMGRARLDAKMLRARRLHEELGVNVAMPVLPRHGPRNVREGAIRGNFPGLEMGDNVHGLSQAIWDVRRVLTWIRTQEPTAIGVYGFSLGAYVASLLGGLEPRLDALVIGCPVVDLIDLFVRNTPKTTTGAERLALLYERARLAHRPISPLHLERVLDRDRIVLLGATNDRLTDPLHQLSRLWEHWDRPQIEFVEGGHLSYIMMNEPVELLQQALRERGVCA